MPQTSNEKKRLSPQLAQIKKLMETGIPWPTGILQTKTVYERQHDDTDGADTGKLQVMILENGDVVVTTDTHRGDPLRFRTPFGGGGSPRVQSALILLALAMVWEKEADRPN